MRNSAKRPAYTRSVCGEHDRTAFALPDSKVDVWLDTSMTDAGQAQDFLRDLPPIEVPVRQVSGTVGNVRNNGPELIEPIVEGERQEIVVLA